MDAPVEQPFENSLAYGLLKQFEAYRSEVEKYAAIVHFCPIPVFVTAHDGLSILYVNPAYIKLTGCDVSELSDYEWAKVIHPDDRERSVAIWQHFIETREPVLMTEKFVNIKTGAVHQCYVTVYAVHNNGMVGFIFPDNWQPTDDIFVTCKVAPPEGLSPST